MNRIIYKSSSLFILIITFISFSFQSQAEKITKTFSKKDNLSIKVASANCKIVKSAKNEIVFNIEFTYDKEYYIPEFSESATEISVKEIFKSNDLHGSAQWLIEVPENVNISVSSASGNIESEDQKGKHKLTTASGNISFTRNEGPITIASASGNVTLEEINKNDSRTDKKIVVSTASGNIRLGKSNGEIKISTASGNFKCNDIKGEISTSSASGNCEIKGLTGSIKYKTTSGHLQASDCSLVSGSEFSTISGDLSLKLSMTLQENLSFNTVSGDICLDFNGNTTNGYYTINSHSRSSRISVPSDFELVNSHKDDVEAEMNYKSGTGTPKISVNTLSGKVSISK